MQIQQHMKRRHFSPVVLGILALPFILSSCGYNKLVQMDEQVKSQWAQVQNTYQRRADLIPNLVNTVKGVANFEKSTLTQVVEARAKATSVNFTADQLTPENMQKFQEAQGNLGSALSRLMVVVEQYPDLKANQNFLDLQAQLEGTENRITVERMKFNQATMDYNAAIRKWQFFITAKMFGFKEKEYFKAAEGTEKPPTVQF